jgi:hypothetical protein
MPDWHTLDWQMLGSVADWTTTVVAIVGGIVAYRAFRKTSETNAAQQETLRLQQRMYEEEQAAQVSLWHEYDAKDDCIGAVWVLNGSDAPIYDVALFTERPIEATWYRDVMVPSGSEPLRVPTDGMQGVPDQLMFRDKLGTYWFRLLDEGQLRKRREAEGWARAQRSRGLGEFGRYL